MGGIWKQVLPGFAKKVRLGGKIHLQLAGNPDYVDGNILLNIDKPCTVQLYIFENSKTVPEINI